MATCGVFITEGFPWVYSEPCPTSKIKLFLKIAKSYIFVDA